MIIHSKIPLSYLFNELKSPIVFVTLISIVSGILPFFFRSFLADIPISIATTLGVSISILLSYKINQSYERWWEARKIWGEIVNDSRTLVLQLKMYIDPENPLIPTICNRNIAWTYCLGHTLRQQDATAVVKEWLSEKDVASLKDCNNLPMGILSLQSQSLRQLHEDKALDKLSQIELEKTITRLTASMGKCERIKKTVFPPIYRYGLHGSIYLFVIFLSLSVAFKLQHFVLEFIILVIVSMVFFFLEKAAYRMQDPFENLPTDTPVTSIAEKIKRDTLGLLGIEDVSTTLKSKSKFYEL